MSVIDLKIVLLGHKYVGKTSIFNRYVYDEFVKTSMTIGAYFAMKQGVIKGRSYNLAIWDTAGEEKFDSLTNFYCRNAKAAVICYDLTNAATFDGLKRWVDKIEAEADEDCSIIIVGNKLDLVQDNDAVRRVAFARAKQYAQSIGADLVEASAKTGHNVNDLFNRVLEACLEKTQEQNNLPNSVKLEDKGKKGRCC